MSEPSFRCERCRVVKPVAVFRCFHEREYLIRADCCRPCCREIAKLPRAFLFHDEIMRPARRKSSTRRSPVAIVGVARDSERVVLCKPSNV